MFLLFLLMHPIISIDSKYNIVNIIYNKFLISKEEKLWLQHKKISRQLNQIRLFVEEFHRSNNELLSKIDDLEPEIKKRYDYLIRPSELDVDKKFEDYLHDLLYDPYGNKYFLDNNSYEIYCNSPEIIKSIPDFMKTQKYSSVMIFKLNFMQYRVKYDIKHIIKNIVKYYEKNRKLPYDVKQLENNLPYEKWGKAYAIDNAQYEVFCAGDNSYKESYLNYDFFEIDKSIFKDIIFSFYYKNSRFPLNVNELGDKWQKDPWNTLYELDTFSCIIRSTKGSIGHSLDYFDYVISANYSHNLENALKKYYKENKKLPDKISDLKTLDHSLLLNKPIEMEKYKNSINIIYKHNNRQIEHSIVIN